MSDLLKLDELTVGYRHRGRLTTVLKAATATLSAGELVGLVGPNGVGKSTLLRSSCGLQPYFVGEVYLTGSPLRRLSRKQRARRMAAVLTDRFDPGRLRVRDVVAMGRYAHSPWAGQLLAADEEIIQRSLQATGSADLQDALLAELSDGQRQRVLVARGLAQEPRVLLLDEPTAFLDPAGQVELLELMRRVSNEFDMGIVVCTHDIELLLRYADTLWVANRQAQLITGNPEQLAFDGTLEATFSTPEVHFNLETLTFQANRGQRPIAAISGTGTAADLARHCLARAGYAVSSSDVSGLRVLARSGDWQLQVGDEVTRCPDLGALFEAVSKISEREKRKIDPTEG